MNLFALPEDETMKAIHYRSVEATDKGRIVAFIAGFRQTLYPMLDHSKLPPDLVAFEQYYLDGPFAGSYLAETQQGQLLGCIAMRPYDHRFNDRFIVETEPVVEVQKLFVLPAWRRKGIGTLLFQKLMGVALQKGIKTLYLHTHPFLSGAETFWARQGFDVKARETEPVFRTIHMIRNVSK